jgi:hypothetical protein
MIINYNFTCYLFYSLNTGANIKGKVNWGLGVYSYNTIFILITIYIGTEKHYNICTIYTNINLI